MFGVGMFFDARLLAMGNLLFVAGIVLIIGPNRTVVFFTRRSKIKGSVCFGVGILLILFKWSFIGFAVELLGILGLFGDFFGVIVGFLRSLPVIGPVLNSPAVAPYIDSAANVRILPV